MAKCILFLEPKGTMLEVVREAKRRGYFVAAIVSDPSLMSTLPTPYSSATSCIDEIRQISNWEAKGELDRLAEEINASHPVCGVYSGLDACTIAGASLRVRFGLPTPSPLTMKVVLDKRLLRQTLREAGLSTLRTFHGAEVDQWKEWKMSGPAYFKPIHGAFSMYVRRCQNLSDLKAAQEAWRKKSEEMPEFLRQYIFSKPEYHLEEAIEGELLSVEGISSRGEFHCIGLTSRILCSKDPTVEMGSCFPYLHPLKDAIIEKVKRAHQALQFTDGPSHVEVIVSPSGEIEIIDFNPRFIGADVLQSINHAYEIKVEEALCDWATGRAPEIRYNGNVFSCLQYILSPGKITFESIEYPAASEVKFHTTFIPSGTQVSNVDRQIDYLGCYLTVMPGFKEALRRSHELRSEVRINNDLQGAF